MISKLCHPAYGIAADGILLQSSSLQANFRMQIFNRDGKEAKMCGNGLLCLAKAFRDEGFLADSCLVETACGLLQLKFYGEGIELMMPKPRLLAKELRLNILDKDWSFFYVDTGVEHLVIQSEEFEDFPLLAMGRELQKHFKQGINFSLCFFSESKLYYRCYERGVEAETGSCGTGACAVATYLADFLDAKFQVFNKEEDLLSVRLEKGDCYLSTKPKKVFSGRVNLSLL